MNETFQLFVYGSLVAEGMGQSGRPCVLRGYRRTWTVAMDNRLDLPGYKYYMEAGTGRRYDGFVTFLNLTAAAGARVNGVLIEIQGPELEELDRRERNYLRVSVGEALDLNVTGPVWCYMGTDSALERFHRGVASGTAVVSGEYFRRVEAAFRTRGPEAFEAYRRTTESPGVPLRELKRIPLPD